VKTATNLNIKMWSITENWKQGST